MQFKGMNLCDFCFTQLNEDGICPHCGLTPETYNLEAGLLAPGTNINGKYIIGSVLGRGGFGATYIAYSSALECAVAIKEYFPISIAYRGIGEEHVSIVSAEKKEIFEKGAQRFFEEAKMISRFNTAPNVVSVYEFFYANNTVYYAMEYLDGVDLKHYIQDHGGMLSESEVIKIMGAVCNALMVVHSTQTLHRDIAPDNIFMGYNGDVKLIDFGASRQVVNDAQAGYSVVLKQGFAPPEQYMSSGNQGVWTDIYAVGATIYYALTGEVPPNAMDRFENPQLIYNSANMPSEALAKIIDKCMAVKIAERYQNAIELLGDLNQMDTLSATSVNSKIPENPQPKDTPVHVSKPSVPYTLKDKLLGNKKALIAASGALVACLLIVIGIFVASPGEESVSTSGGGATNSVLTKLYSYDEAKVNFQRNGNKFELEQPAVTHNGVHMVYYKDVFKLLGVDVKMENDIISGTYNGGKFEINLLLSSLHYNKTAGEAAEVKKFETVPILNRTGLVMLPVKEVLVFFGVQVVEDSANNTLNVITQKEEEEREEAPKSKASSTKKSEEKVKETVDTKTEAPSANETVPSYTPEPSAPSYTPTTPQEPTPSRPRQEEPVSGNMYPNRPAPKPTCSTCGSESHTVHPTPPPSVGGNMYPNRTPPRSDIYR